MLTTHLSSDAASAPAPASGRAAPAASGGAADLRLRLPDLGSGERTVADHALLRRFLEGHLPVDHLGVGEDLADPHAERLSGNAVPQTVITALGAG